MENKRALFLIEKSNLSDRDKQFLITHLEMYDSLSQSFFNDAHLYREMLDQSNGLDSRYLSIKENVILILENLYNELKNAEDIQDSKERLSAFLKLLELDLANILRIKEILDAQKLKRGTDISDN